MIVHDWVKVPTCKTCISSPPTTSILNEHITYVHNRRDEIQCSHRELRMRSTSTTLAHLKEVHGKVKTLECEKFAHASETCISQTSEIETC